LSSVFAKKICFFRDVEKRGEKFLFLLLKILDFDVMI